MAYVAQSRKGESIVGDRVVVETSSLGLPEVATLEEFVGGLIPRLVAFVRSYHEPEVLTLVCDRHGGPVGYTLLHFMGKVLECAFIQGDDVALVQIQV